MRTNEVINYLEKEGVDKLYKKFQHYFEKVDKWSEIFTTGDLLDELQLAHAMDELTGVYCQFHTIAGALDAYKTNKELNFKVKAYKEMESQGKKATVSQIEEMARQHTTELRTYRADFLNYADACEKGIGTTQSRLKRLIIESHAKRISGHGEVPVENFPEKDINEELDQVSEWDE